MGKPLTKGRKYGPDIIGRYLKMKHLLFVLMAFIPNIIYGQSISSDVEKIGNSLLKNGIDTFIIYKNYFPGGMPVVTIPENATQAEINKAFFKAVDPVYAIYKHDEKLFISMSKEGHVVKKVSVKNCKSFTAFIKNFDAILHETIVPNSYIDKEGDTIETDVDHFPVTDFYLMLGKRKKEISIDLFDLRPTDNPYRDKNQVTNKNINYKCNKRTKIVALASLLEDEIPKKIKIAE